MDIARDAIESPRWSIVCRAPLTSHLADVDATAWWDRAARSRWWWCRYHRRRLDDDDDGPTTDGEEAHDTARHRCVAGAILQHKVKKKKKTKKIWF